MHGATSSSLTHANSTGASNVPFNLARYSEIFSSHHDRILNDERQRILNQSFAQNNYKSSSSNIDHSPSQVNQSHSNERRIENNSDLLNHSGSSSSILGKREYISSGSIMSGTPRDFSQNSFSNMTRKSHVPPISASIKPLNLSSNSDHSSGNDQSSYLWRPQNDNIKESGFDSFKKTGNQPEQVNLQENSIKKISDNIQSLNQFNQFNPKKQRLNHYVNSNENFMSNGFTNEIHNEDVVNKTGVIQANVNGDKQFNNSNHLPHDDVINHKTLIPINESPKIISKLDIDEMKLKQKRQRKSEESDDEDESEEESDDDDDDDEDYENKLKNQVILTNVCPLKLDTSPDKMKFLESFNLTTHDRKNKIELNKYMKRRTILGEVTPPLQLEWEGNHEVEKQNHVLNCTNIMPDSIASQERNIEVKLNYMNILGLKVQTSLEKQKNAELLWQGVLHERESRLQQNRCWTKLLNNFNNEMLNKWLSNLQTEHGNESLQNGYYFNGLISNPSTTSNMKYFNVNNHLNTNKLTSQKGQRKVVLFNKHSTSKTNDSNSEKRSHLQVSSKDFAQEFHQSVLLQTTRQQIAKQQKASIQTETKQNHYADLSSSSHFKWPGIESIMEAYELYSIGMFNSIKEITAHAYLQFRFNFNRTKTRKRLSARKKCSIER